MRLKVTGQDGDGDIKSAEFATTDSILCMSSPCSTSSLRQPQLTSSLRVDGRVTTRMKASPVPGTCHGKFALDLRRDFASSLLDEYRPLISLSLSHPDRYILLHER